MDNAQKAIMIGVGLFITIIIISVVLLITTMGTGVANEAKNNIKGISTSMQQQLATAYDGQTVNKSELLTCVNMYGANTGIIINFGTIRIQTTAEYNAYIGTITTARGAVAIADTGVATITFTAVNGAFTPVGTP